MNYIRHLGNVLQKLMEDENISPYHISLYMVLFYSWNFNRFKNPISINRQEIMRASKIGSVNTYLRSLQDLSKWGYLEYLPSRNPFKGSLINLYDFGTGNEQELVHFQYNNETTENNTTESEVSPLLNNNKHIETSLNIPKNENEVFEFFKNENWPEIEAKKFYNYFESNGWKVGGKAPMENWQAAARSWILNGQKFNKNKKLSAGNLNTPTNKNYGEPL